MSKIKILKETDATRCEICHQSDCYSAETDTCSRCSNIDLPANIKINDQRSISRQRQNRRITKPVVLKIVDTESIYSISYRWQSYNYRRNSVLLILSWLFGGGMLRGSLSNPLLFISLIIVYGCALLLLLITKTTITISHTKLIKDNWPINLFSHQEILLSDIKYIHYERHLHDSGRLVIRLNNGSLIELINNIDDRDAMLFLEQNLKEKVNQLSSS